MGKKITNRISIYRLLDHLNFESIDISAIGKNFVLEYQSDGTKLYIQKDRESTPAWVSYLSPYLGSVANTIKNKSASFVLLINYNNRIYAISGGYGYTVLKDICEENFGLKVALRMIDELDVSFVNQRSLNGTTRQLFRVVTGYRPGFDRENYNRILKYIEGKGEFEDRKFTIKGRSSLVLRTEKDISKITEVLYEVENILDQEEKVHFPKSYEQVTNVSKINTLEEQLFCEFKLFWEQEEHRDNMYLEFDDPFQQFKCTDFIIRYKRKKIEIKEFDLEIIRYHMKGKSVRKIDEYSDIESLNVTGINDDGFVEVDRIPFSHMLVFEAIIDGTHYMKYSGKWYLILDEIKEHINNELSTAEVTYDLLPHWDETGYLTENDYNKFVEENTNLKCLDKDLVMIEGEGKSRVELCDLFDPEEKSFYHVKKTWGCKSTYLFTQASTAIETYKNLKSYRDKCKELWPDLFHDDIMSGTLVIGIAAKPEKFDGFPLNLSYFAKLNLYSAISIIKQNNFNVVLAPIKLV